MIAITSDLQSLLRASFASLITIAALLGMSGTARAQLYISQLGVLTVSEYNATTGAAINTNLITRLSTPSGLDEPRTSQSVKGAEVLFRRVEEFDIMLKKTADDKYLSQVRSGCRKGWIRQ